ncbi:MAG: 3-dehydroquinate synthase [Omnitrophica bacterium RIFCSPLOWO2_12_FULL_44_17]|uniref:3-dehydroquinate synthase n=1 Tax=Candidatus Danuiimicrobium aquiferis TaxID=1801832 RepID=A0A1G1L1Y3_9BACT|nr:MAG: 3-dehydroquinate synthase [Omnitrophica bacterium RIFCSPHIGHO2_02_FULL_45_28]OGW88786.1 MAG: 3-dehydroquinate synthase [Omnitrophica bacterium RIFCSPHIGHO2_12_FULL_44_12]OGW99157.1 MAG: 3-dehydroquinate synthase [Omnitrophica bacterium RIFCSPLOWO2_12_FULL_44_17]OGX04426.1 MAG: 3-dehydroquinate synthase [Omnitrophica bacterium RIFCSPLOWO2_02_FULL_44_11]
MKQIKVKHAKGQYKILIGTDLLPKTGVFLKSLVGGRKILIVSHRTIAKYHSGTVKHSLEKAGFEVHSYLLPYGGERDKSEQVLKSLWKKMADIGLDRSSALLALGGGVVGDLAGFAAATYMRGISVVQVPTTLLAQVDSAIGGKTGMDLYQVKNIVGAFHQPRMVICDMNTLKTLPLAEFRNAFAEVIKYGVIWDAKLFDLLEKKTAAFFTSLNRGKLNQKDFSFLEIIVYRSAKVKAEVVCKDEFETSGLRMILNYGHTFGHAFESVSNYRISHGEAVAVGMMLAGELALREGLFPKSGQARQVKLLRESGLLEPWFRGRYAAAKLVSFMKKDKKAKAGALRLVLPRTIGRVEVRSDFSGAKVLSFLKDVLTNKTGTGVNAQ